MMKTKTLLLIGSITVATVTNLVAGTTVDDFNRTTGLGPNWTADAEYEIINNELSNTRTTPDWTSLAVFNSITNPIEVSFKWSPTASTEGANSGGIAVRLNSANVNATGYLIMRRYTKVRLSAIVNGIVDHTITEVNASQSDPGPNDVLSVIVSSDANGHHFDVYQNGVFDARVTDTNKSYGNTSTWYSGVSLFGDRNNNIDDFTVRYPTISVVSPNGGEEWTVNTVHSIQWTSDSYTGNVKLEYSLNGGTSWTTIVGSTPNSGTYAWTVPNTPSVTCLVKVSDAGDGDPSDQSNAYFRISTAAQTIAVLSPNGGESWIIGNQYDITWYATGGIANVKIEYSIDNGTSWVVLAASTPNSGSYTWVPAPADSSRECKVRISDASDNVPADISDGNFALLYSVELRVVDASGEPGTNDNIVSIYMKNPVTVRGIQFTLSDVPNLLTATSANVTARTGGFSVAFNETGTSVNLILYQIGNAVIAAGEGNILEVHYSIDGTAQAGDSTQLILSDVNVADENNNDVLTEIFNGVFSFATPGDVSGPGGNPDGIVDWNDINRLVELVMGGNPSEYELLVADFDHDGDVDIYDLLAAYDLMT